MQSSASTQPPGQVLTNLRNTLLKLHKELLDSEKAVYERDIEKIRTPGQFLNLVMEDPWFAYLRELSRFVVTIDEKLDDKESPVTALEAAEYVKKAQMMLVPAEFGRGFEKRYFEALQRDPNVVLAHAAASRVISGLRAA